MTTNFLWGISHEDRIEVKSGIKSPWRDRSNEQTTSRKRAKWVNIKEGKVNGLFHIIKIREYCDYVEEHLRHVEESWMTLREKCQKMRFVYDDYTYWSIDHMVKEHDMSKLSPEEFIQYQRNFFPVKEGDPKALFVPTDEQNQIEKDAAKAGFKEAWEHHKSANGHHWQNWTKNEPYYNPYEAECHCVCMVIDWMAMGLKFGDTAESYYEGHKDEIKLPEWAVTFIHEIFEALKVSTAINQQPSCNGGRIAMKEGETK